MTAAWHLSLSRWSVEGLLSSGMWRFLPNCTASRIMRLLTLSNIKQCYWYLNVLVHKFCNWPQFGPVSDRRKFTCSSHLTPPITEMCRLLINYDSWRGWKVEMHDLAKQWSHETSVRFWTSIRYGEERSGCGLKEWQGLYRKSLMKLSYCNIQTVTHRLMALYALVVSRWTFRQLNWVRLLVSVCTFVYVWVVCFVSVVGNEKTNSSVLDT